MHNEENGGNGDTFAEVSAETLMVVDGLVGSQEPNGLQLVVERRLRKHGLHDIRSIEIVHTVCADNAFLKLNGSRLR
jgi:hypothetical protein